MYLDKNIEELKSGLSEEHLNMNIILKQFNCTKNGHVNSGSLIFDDGQIYMLVKGADSSLKWSRFTKLKHEGIRGLEKLIQDEFLLVESLEPKNSTAQNMLIWESGLKGKKHRVIQPALAFASLAPVFRKIEDTINLFMVRLSELHEK
ncbi:MAG TPA: hypothetical protein VEP89_05940 [Draconibacterium sp.]|nr:hypothetical protein [Draconibacterium sp.]